MQSPEPSYPHLSGRKSLPVGSQSPMRSLRLTLVGGWLPSGLGGGEQYFLQLCSWQAAGPYVSPQRLRSPRLSEETPGTWANSPRPLGRQRHVRTQHREAMVSLAFPNACHGDSPKQGRPGLSPPRAPCS